VDALKSVSRDTLYRDSELSGFALRAKPSGIATWVVQYRNSAGRTRKLALGRVGVLTPEEARQRARRALAKVADGEDPSASRNAVRGAMTVADLCRDYLADANKGFVLGKAKRPKAKSTLMNDKSRIESHVVPMLGRLSVSEVRQADVRRFMHAIQTGKVARKGGNRSRAAGGVSIASRTVGMLGGIFSYAVRQGLRADNPVKGIERPADQRRTAFLSMEDYRRLGVALAASEAAGENPMAIQAVRLLALTGCRKGEVTALTWTEVDLQAHQLRLLHTKEGHSVRPLGQAAVDLLGAVPRHAPCDVVLAGGIEGRPYVGLARAWKRIAERAKFKNFTLHTLRHSFATTANMLGCSEPTIAALLGHSRGTMTSRYIHHVDAVLLGAADRVSGAIARAMAGEKVATIHSLDGTRRSAASAS